MELIDIYLKIRCLPLDMQEAEIIKLCDSDPKLISNVHFLIDLNTKNNDVQSSIPVNENEIHRHIDVDEHHKKSILADLTIKDDKDDFDEFEVFLRVEHLKDSPLLLDEKIQNECKGIKERIDAVYRLIKGDRIKESGVSVHTIINESMHALQQGSFDPKTLEGAHADKYLIIKHIKTGGNSYVYLAERCDEIKHQVVVKVIKPHLHNMYDYNVINREANILFQFNHKYIVPLSNVGIIEHGNIKLPFYCMPYISDQTITSHAKVMGLSIEKRIINVIKVSIALTEAHDLDMPVIHADIKPPNVLMDIKGEPKVIDFGIAQHQYDTELSDSDRIQSYAQKYSDCYSCPELLAGSALTVQADVFSLGIVLYELLTEISPVFDKKLNHLTFDIINNLPSNNLVQSFVKKSKYRFFAKELDSIILKATQKNPDLRYNSVTAFRADLQRFLNYKEVESANKSYIYNLSKMLMSTPRYATFAIGLGLTVIISASISLATLSYATTTDADYLLASKISQFYYNEKTLPKYTSQLLLKDSALALNEHINASQEALRKAALDLAKTADYMMLWDHSEFFYTIVLKNTTLEEDKILVLPLLAKALYKQNKLTEAEQLIDSIYSTISIDSDNNNINFVVAYLELLDFDTKYISSYFDDGRDDLEILKHIDKHFFNIPTTYQSKLKYLIATEYFYAINGDPFHPSAGYSDIEYQKNIYPLLVKAQDFIQQAINIDIDDRRKPINYALSSRIEHELKDYKKAQALSAQALRLAKDYENQYNNSIEKSLIAKYSVNRHTNLTVALDAAKELVYLYENRGINDDWYYGAYMLSNAYLALEDITESRFIIFEMIRHFKDLKNSLVFKGYDGLVATIINYLEHTNFDLSDEFSLSTIPVLKQAFNHTVLTYPDYIQPYEKSFIALISAAYAKNEHVSKSIINNLIINRQSDQLSSADSEYQLALNAAGIMTGFNDIDMAYQLANIAEKSMVWSNRERTHSIDKMQNYLQLSEIYLKSGDNKSYLRAFNEVKIVYKNHVSSLKHTKYKDLID